jgi:hypothetical protein
VRSLKKVKKTTFNKQIKNKRSLGLIIGFGEKIKVNRFYRETEKNALLRDA